ncbi:MAG: PH domain-containing protein [Candidatus Aenigmatarchaeota archaeon]
MKSKTIVNVPHRKWVGIGYIVITIMFSVLFTSMIYMVSSKLDGGEMTPFYVLYAFIITMFVLIIIAYYRTKYTIKDGMLSSWSPFMAIRLPLKNILKVERTVIPIHMRVGASLYSGLFYIPNVGWTRAIMTNLHDGLLIRAKGGRKYLITPSNPEKFAKLLKR